MEFESTKEENLNLYNIGNSSKKNSLSYDYTHANSPQFQSDYMNQLFNKYIDSFDQRREAEQECSSVCVKTDTYKKGKHAESSFTGTKRLSRRSKRRNQISIVEGIKYALSFWSDMVSTLCRPLIFAVIIFAIIVLARVAVTGKTDVFGYRFYVILSGSMVPTINIDDIVVVDGNAEIEPDSVIAYQDEGCVFVHRVIDTKTTEDGKTYLTQGDANNTADEHYIEKKDIKGVVVCKLPGLGKPLMFLRRNIILVVAGVLIMTILSLRRVK